MHFPSPMVRTLGTESPSLLEVGPIQVLLIRPASVSIMLSTKNCVCFSDLAILRRTQSAALRDLLPHRPCRKLPHSLLGRTPQAQTICSQPASATISG